MLVPIFCTSRPYLSVFSWSSCVIFLRSFEIYSGFTISWSYLYVFLYAGIHRWRYSNLIKPNGCGYSHALILSHESIAGSSKASLALALERKFALSLTFQLGYWPGNNIDFCCQQHLVLATPGLTPSPAKYIRSLEIRTANL